MKILNRRTGRGLVLCACSMAVLGACGSPSTTSAKPADRDGEVHVTASFYPLQFIAQRIVGSEGRVGSLTRPGAEPHDLELSPQDVAAVSRADLVVYLKGFQSSVDDAVAQAAPDRAFDAAPTAHLDRTYTPIEDGEQEHGEAGSTDPHFWLDPTRLAAVSDALAQRLERLRPHDAATFRANATTLRRDLAGLDLRYRDGLSGCANKDLVTSHNAFGYLAQRYGLEQVGITGLNPDQEPSGADLAAVTRFVRDHKVRTIYYETLISPAIARTVASETGAATAVLDPIEGLTPASQGKNYLEVMRSNLKNIRQGQPCT